MQMVSDMYIPKCKSYANIPCTKVLILKDMQQGASHKMAFTFPSPLTQSPSPPWSPSTVNWDKKEKGRCRLLLHVERLKIDPAAPYFSGADWQRKSIVTELA